MKIIGKSLHGCRYSNHEFEARVIANPEGQMLLFILSADGSIDILLPADDIYRAMQKVHGYEN